MVMEVEIEQYRLKLQAIGWSQAALDRNGVIAT